MRPRWGSAVSTTRALMVPRASALGRPARGASARRLSHSAIVEASRDRTWAALIATDGAMGALRTCSGGGSGRRRPRTNAVGGCRSMAACPASWSRRRPRSRGWPWAARPSAGRHSRVPRCCPTRATAPRIARRGCLPQQRGRACGCAPLPACSRGQCATPTYAQRWRAPATTASPMAGAVCGHCQRGAAVKPRRQLGHRGVHPSALLALAFAAPGCRLTTAAVGPPAMRASHTGIRRGGFAPIVSA